VACVCCLMIARRDRLRDWSFQVLAAMRAAVRQAVPLGTLYALHSLSFLLLLVLLSFFQYSSTASPAIIARLAALLLLPG
jgi:hypothetical protein